MKAKLDDEKAALKRMNEDLATDLEMDGVDFRVFLSLLATLNFQTFTVVRQVELTTLLGRRKEHISRSILKLEAKGIIVSGSKVGRSMEWRLNREYAQDS